MKRVAVVHTGFVSVEPLAGAFARLGVSIELTNIVDDSLLKETIASGAPTSRVVQRMCWYYAAAEQLGAQAILNACSSVGEAADIAAKTVSIPVIKVDAAMAQAAVDVATRIALVATVPSTVGPSTRLIRRTAAEQGRAVDVVPHLCTEAFPLIEKGDKEGHDRLLIEAIRSAAETSEAVVLAQVSMARLLDSIGDDIKTPVFASPMLAAELVARAVGAL